MTIVVDENFCGPIPVIIKVIGVGGGGTNAINRMIEGMLAGVEFITINTDLQDLVRKSIASNKIQIGKKLTGGRGAGGNPEKGEKAANEDHDLIREQVKDADMVVITAGMGGGTGTGAAPVIAQIAKEEGVLTVAVVTKPFGFEGPYKMALAEEGIRKLRGVVDTLITIPNQQLLSIVEQKTSLIQAYQKADEVLCEGVRSISDLITRPGLVNIDFADVESTMKNQGDALLGIGIGSGENRAAAAAQKAIDNPLLEATKIDGATRILVNVSANNELALTELDEIINIIRSNADPNVSIIHGVTLAEELGDSVRVTVIATGFQGKNQALNNSGVAGEPVKPRETDFIDITEWQKIRGATKPVDFLSRRGEVYTEEDLDVPAIMRKTPKPPPSDPSLPGLPGVSGIKGL
ncbi:MAG: cell division protein FtsZ [Treponema sp.]|jgi:cell division protein FtsZ|nr:cell division protein FtsZ [Treponema sp.]